MLEQGKGVSRPPPEEEGAAETACDELTATPIPALLHRCGGEEAEECGAKLSPGRRLNMMISKLVTILGTIIFSIPIAVNGRLAIILLSCDLLRCNCASSESLS